MTPFECEKHAAEGINLERESLSRNKLCKFLGVIYHTLKNDWMFEDFPKLARRGTHDIYNTRTL